VWKFLPETKNLPVEEIIGLFEHQQTTLPEGRDSISLASAYCRFRRGLIR
jgi:hypothetical protein